MVDQYRVLLGLDASLLQCTLRNRACPHSNFANNLFASCDSLRPGDGTTQGISMNDNNGALAVIIISQWVTILLLALILWRLW